MNSNLWRTQIDKVNIETLPTAYNNLKEKREMAWLQISQHHYRNFSYDVHPCLGFHQSEWMSRGECGIDIYNPAIYFVSCRFVRGIFYWRCWDISRIRITWMPWCMFAQEWTTYHIALWFRENIVPCWGSGGAKKLNTSISTNDNTKEIEQSHNTRKCWQGTSDCNHRKNERLSGPTKGIVVNVQQTKYYQSVILKIFS